MNKNQSLVVQTDWPATDCPLAHTSFRTLDSSMTVPLCVYQLSSEEMTFVDAMAVLIHSPELLCVCQSPLLLGWSWDRSDQCE